MKNNEYNLYDKNEVKKTIRQGLLFIVKFYVLTPIFIMIFILFSSFIVKPGFEISIKLIVQYMGFLYIFLFPLFAGVLIGVLIYYLVENKRLKWNIEPKYGLFYVNEEGNIIKISKFPTKVIELALYRPCGFNIDVEDCVALETGDIIKVTVQNYEATTTMSTLEQATAFSIFYIRYQTNWEFEKISCENDTNFVEIYSY